MIGGSAPLSRMVDDEVGPDLVDVINYFINARLQELVKKQGWDGNGEADLSSLKYFS